MHLIRNAIGRGGLTDQIPNAEGLARDACLDTHLLRLPKCPTESLELLVREEPEWVTNERRDAQSLASQTIVERMPHQEAQEGFGLATACRKPQEVQEVTIPLPFA